MMTMENILEAIRALPKEDKDALRNRLEDVLSDNSPSRRYRRGEGLRAAAGSLHVDGVLDPAPSRESIYEEADR